VDMETGAMVAVTTHGGAVGDTTSVGETLPAAGEAVAEPIAEPTTNGKFEVNAKGVEEHVADKGYHSGDVLVYGDFRYGPTLRNRIADGGSAGQGNRVGGSLRTKPLLRRRGELVERTFAHAYETGALRRFNVRGKQNVQKRLLPAAACNLALLLLRKMIGAGTLRAMQDVVAHLLLVLLRLISAMNALNRPARPLPAVISRQMPHRHRCTQQEL
jgi:transposase